MPDLESLLDQSSKALTEGELEKALDLAEQAVQKDPGSPDAHFLRGEALLDLLFFEEAVEAYQKADDLLPDHPDILSGLGMALFECIRFIEAEAILEDSLDLDPEMPEAHQTLALILERKNDPRAKDHFDRAHQLSPDAYPLPVIVTADEFDQCIQNALAELPKPVQKAIKNTPVSVEPYPQEADLTASKPPLTPQILGLYRGASLKEKTVFNPWTELPGEILLYQNNLQRHCQDREELVVQIRITVLHEIGHLLGLTEEDLDDRGLK
jgi:predicted Zn-dependent protease with MMP-like domain